jgi:hypothetical protein
MTTPKTKKRSTAFYINGGIGRVICSIPALERYAKDNPNDDFIVCSEFSYEAFSGHPILHSRSYPINGPHLFKDQIQHRNFVYPDPYHVWEYYNQKCSIAEAFDICINGNVSTNPSKPSVYLSNEELITAKSMIEDMRQKNKKPVFIFQPFGKGITTQVTQSTTGPVDGSGRSFTVESAAELIKLIEHKYSILLMNEFNVDFQALGCKNETFFVENINLRKWFSLLSECDAFIGCDSIGQHIANVFNKPSYVILGSTFAKNVSYPNSDLFNIFDFNKDKKIYSPIRIVEDECPDRQNEKLMMLTNAQIKEIADKITYDI